LQIKESAENYLETILMINERKGNVRSIDIVNELEFSKPSVSVAMKNLRENGYISMGKDGYISLTDKGLAIAAKMYERHKLLSSYLQALGVPKKTAVEDACRIEHVISEESFNAIKEHATKKLTEKKED
jgi:Mn-dependent DtxR family transcriptional regulator